MDLGRGVAGKERHRMDGKRGTPARRAVEAGEGADHPPRKDADSVENEDEILYPD